MVERCTQDFDEKKAEWKRSLGITRRRRKDDIKVDLIEIV